MNKTYKSVGKDYNTLTPGKMIIRFLDSISYAS